MVRCRFCNQVMENDKTFCNRKCCYSYLKTCKGNKNPFFGKKHDDNTKEVMRRKKLGNTLSEEHKQNIAKSLKGRKLGSPSSEHRKNLSLSLRDGFKKGRIVWNKGLTKDVDDSVRSTANKLSVIAKNRIGVKNSFFGKKHTQLTKEKHSKFMKGRFVGEENAFFGKTHNEKTKSKLSNLAKVRSELPEVKARLREQGVNAVLLGKKHSTKIEIMVKEELKKRNIDFVFQYKFRDSNGKYVAVSDFAFPERKIILEVYGDFHHANPKIYPKNDLSPIQLRTIKNDERKKLLYEKENWDLIIVWGSDIEENVSKCVDSVIKILNAHRQN